jgi:TrmH family RNA methyltransferase
MEVISSAKNPKIKEIKKLGRRAHRDETGLCFVDGIQPVLRAIDNSLEIETLVYCPELLKSELALQTVQTQNAQGTNCLPVSAAVFEHISERDNPVGLAAVIRQRYHALEELRTDDTTILAVLHDVKNPGNLGTIIRTVDAIAGRGVVLLGQTADPFDTACIKASMGTVFNIPLVCNTPQQFLNWCRQKGVTLITTSAKAPADIGETSFAYPCAAMFGSEAQGLPQELLEAGDTLVRIPMYGQASSLNLAVAAGIVLYEVRKRIKN